MDRLRLAAQIVVAFCIVTPMLTVMSLVVLIVLQLLPDGPASGPFSFLNDVHFHGAG